MIRHILLFVLLGGGFLISAQEKNILGMETRRDAILASVNGESVTLQDVILESSAEESKLAALYTGPELLRKIEEVRRKILDDLINHL